MNEDYDAMGDLDFVNIWGEHDFVAINLNPYECKYNEGKCGVRTDVKFVLAGTTGPVADFTGTGADCPLSEAECSAVCAQLNK
jgi:hypothetical protein